MKIFNNNVSFISIILFVVFALLTFWIPFNSYGCSVNQGICVILMAIALISNVKTNVMQLVYFIPYIAATDFSIFGVPLHVITYLELLLFIKVFRQFPLEGKHIRYFAFFTIYSLIPMILCHAELAGLVKYLFNFLLFLAVYYLFTKEDKYSLNNVYLALALGVLTSCIAGRYYVRPVTEEVFDITESWLRYKGLWTDPNFLGCFCILGILSLLLTNTNTKFGRILTWGGCIIIFYYGTLTMSRTYLVVSALLLAIFTYRSLKGSFSTNLVAIAILILCIPVLTDYYNTIQNNRVIASTTLTNGRVDDTKALLEAQSTDICAFFGAGCNNYSYLYSILGSNQDKAAAHNSYVDILLQFGYIGVLILIFFITKNWKKMKTIIRALTEVYGLPMVCVLLYLGTLSALKYEFVYIIAAIFYTEFLSRKHRKL